MDWYKTLSVDQKINLKDSSLILIGMSWEGMGLLFSFRERIDILYNKLKLVDFDI